MFQRASTQRHSTMTTRAQSMATTKTTLTNENAVATAKNESISLKSKQTSVGQPENITRKRRALGDVSNQQPLNVDLAASKTMKPAVKTIAQRKPLAPQQTQNTEIVASRTRRKSLEKQKIDEQLAKQAELMEREAIQKKAEEVKRQKVAVVKDWDDLDADDHADPVMVSEYVVEIFEYLRKLELTTMPDPEYMLKQKDLQWKMRSILIDWLVEVHGRFRLLPETLFLTVNIIDRFLSLRNVSIKKLQLVGITAMFIAAKYEEVYAPSINQFVYITDGGYSNDEVIKAERYILAMLDFNLQFPNPLNFLRRCSKADDYDLQTRNYAKYLLEVAMIDENFLAYPPSLLAASGMCLSRVVLGRGSWNNNMKHYSGYTVSEMKECIMRLLDTLNRPRKYSAVYNKYKAKKFQSASIYFEEWIRLNGGDSTYNVEWEKL